MMFDAEVVVVCPYCHKATTISVVTNDYFDWKEGKLIQDAMPYLSTEDREALISGLCPDCQREVFQPPEGWGNEEDWDDEPDDIDSDEGFDPYEGCYTFDC